MTANASNLTARANLDLEQDRLKIAYTIKNGSPDRICVFNRLFDEGDSSFDLNPNRAYLSVEGSDAVVITKRIIDIPDGMDVERPECPYMSCIEPGATFAEEFELAVPLRLDHPYVASYQKGQQEQIVKRNRILFSVGYIVPSDKIWAKKTQLKGEEVWETDQGLGLIFQRILRFDEEKLPITLALPEK